MRTYYFDTKDGVPVRDNKGLPFATTSSAIEYSKKLAGQLRTERARDSDLYVSVVSDSGAEVHREPVYPTKLCDESAKAGGT